MIARVAQTHLCHHACTVMRVIHLMSLAESRPSGFFARCLQCNDAASFKCITALSALLCCVPALADTPLIIAHRGASRDAPENTLAAFRLAWEQDTDGIETDIQLTRDGHVVCIHDADTRKVADRNLVVRNSALEELQQLDVSVRHGAKFRGERIPTLSEILETVPPGKLVYLDIKCGPEIIPPMLAVVDAASLTPEQVTFLAFDAEIIRELKERAPDFKAHWLCRIRKGRFFGRLRPSIEEVLTTLRESRADGFATRHSDITDTFITTVTAKGYEHHVWTVNSTDAAARFKKLGTTSIITDVPALLKASFAEESPQ